MWLSGKLHQSFVNARKKVDCCFLPRGLGIHGAWSSSESCVDGRIHPARGSFVSSFHDTVRCRVSVELVGSCGHAQFASLATALVWLAASCVEALGT